MTLATATAWVVLITGVGAACIIVLAAVWGKARPKQQPSGGVPRSYAYAAVSFSLMSALWLSVEVIGGATWSDCTIGQGIYGAILLPILTLASPTALLYIPYAFLAALPGYYKGKRALAIEVVLLVLAVAIIGFIGATRHTSGAICLKAMSP